MTTIDILPLAFLYTDEERPIEGLTRFQKLVFLAQEEMNIGKKYQFQPDTYGSYSNDLYDSIRELEERGLLQERRRQTPAGNTKFVYSITDDGRELLDSVLEMDEYEHLRELLERAEEIKREYGGQSLHNLLEYVSEEYPKYTSGSGADASSPEA